MDNVLYMSSGFGLPGVESRDFSQAEKERTACKAEEIHKITTIFTQNGPRLSFLSDNVCHFVNLLCFASSSFT
jgi:hypothetical protein